MTNSPGYVQYVEALTALATVDDRRRDAIRKVVESATEAEIRETTKVADQQRMYARVARDIDAADRALAELRSLGAFPPVPVAPNQQPSTETTPSLATIRGAVAEIAGWIDDTKPVLASLLRSRDRLAQATTQPPASPLPQSSPNERTMFPIRAAAGFAVIVVVIMVVIIASQV